MPPQIQMPFWRYVYEENIVKHVFAFRRTHRILILSPTQSLFPQDVKDRLLEEKAEQVAAAEQRQQAGQRKGLDKELAALFSGQVGFGGEDYVDEEDDDAIDKSKPLCDEYPECTILFADIVGFVSSHFQCST